MKLAFKHLQAVLGIIMITQYLKRQMVYLKLKLFVEMDHRKMLMQLNMQVEDG